MKVLHKDNIIPYNRIVEKDGRFLIENRLSLASQWRRMKDFDNENEARIQFQKWVDSYDEDDEEYYHCFHHDREKAVNNYTVRIPERINYSI